MTEEAAQQNNQPLFNMEKIYVKDLSLEIPNAPQVFLERENPQIDVQLQQALSPLVAAFQPAGPPGRVVPVRQISQPGGTVRLGPPEGSHEPLARAHPLTDRHLPVHRHLLAVVVPLTVHAS